MEEKIKAAFIFEMLGRPPEHIKATLEQFIGKLGEQPGIELINKKIHEPRPLETKDDKGDTKENRELFTTFAEVELNIDNLDLVFAIVLNMLPANVEIIEPTSLKLNNFDISKMLSELTIKLHKYDEIAKSMMIREGEFTKKINELQEKISELEKGKKNKTENKKSKDKVKKKEKPDKR